VKTSKFHVSLKHKNLLVNDTPNKVCITPSQYNSTNYCCCLQNARSHTLFLPPGWYTPCNLRLWKHWSKR